MSRPLHVEVSDLARAQIRAAEAWWRVNRPKAPNAIREELERASLLISVQPEIGARVPYAREARSGPSRQGSRWFVPANQLIHWEKAALQSGARPDICERRVARS